MRASDVTIEWLEERLEGWEGSEGQYAAWCPCHDDLGTTHKGLSISVLGKKILCKCHSCGAQLPDVIEALSDEEPADEIVVNIRKHRNGGSPDSTAEPQSARADFTHAQAWWVEKTGVPWEVWEELGCEAEQGEIHFLFAGFDIYKYRRPPKEFGWSRRGDDNPPLWPVPEDELPKHIWILEGESDTGTGRAAGHHAFGITKGAGKGEKRYLDKYAFEALRDRGVEEVTLCGDMDDSGEEFMAYMAKAAVDAGLIVNLVHLREILDPFAGINDLNGVYKAAENLKEFHTLIARATKRVATRYTTLTTEELTKVAQEEVPWLVPELIAPGDKVLISGPQKSLKTYLALDLLRCLTTCSPFMQREQWTPKVPMRTLFIQEEGSIHAWANRVRRLKLKKGAPAHFWFREGIRFTETSTIDEVISFCREHEVECVFFDPMQRMIPGVDENDASATGVVWDEIFRLQLALPHLVVIVVHHSNKTERLTWESIRGSSRHAGEVDLGIFVQKHPQEERTLQIAVDGRDISSDLAPGESFEGKYEITDDTFTLDAKEVIQVNVNPVKKMAMGNRDSILNAIADGCRTKEAIVSQTGLSEASVRNHLKTLIADERVKEIDNGKGRAKTYEVKEDSGHSDE